MKYRKEIDGLRAIAILPVLFFHAGIDSVSGGYVGVDVFFVISGYLITSIILSEVQNNKFSIINFYERRARRILPALSFVLFFTTISAYILMPPILLREYSQSLVSVASFLSNLFFYLESGYFARAADEMPLLHTWSLAIEEQYYIFFPIMVSVLWVTAKRSLFPAMIVITIVSLLYSQYLSIIGEADANFYLIFSRAWELFAGSIVAYLALFDYNFKRWQKELLSLLGVTMILCAVFLFDSRTPFPGIYALIPVLGTCMVIFFCDERTYTGRLLSVKPLIAIGLISYSLYLWHQPIFAFMRMKSIGEPPNYVFGLAIIISIIIAAFSWKYVEAPFRNKQKFDRIQIFKLSGLSIILFLMVGLIGHFNQGFSQRFDLYNVAQYDAVHNEVQGCNTVGYDYLKPENSCQYFGEKVSWAVLGDSHADMFSYTLADTLKNKGEGIQHLSFSGCVPSSLIEWLQIGCSEWGKEAVRYIEQSENITNVLLGIRHSSYLYGGILDDFPEIPDNDIRDELSDEYSGLDSKAAEELYWDSFENIVSRFVSAKKTVYILYPVPELPVDLDKAVSPYSIFNEFAILSLSQATSVDFYNRRHKATIKHLDALPYGENVIAIFPNEVFCDEEFCTAIKNDQLLYVDDNHVSNYGAQLIIDSFLSE